MRVRNFAVLILCLLCVALTSCGFVSYVRTEDPLEATRNEYIALLMAMADENDYSEEKRREYQLTLIEVQNLIREADSFEQILAIFEEYSNILGNIPLNIELKRSRITEEMKKLAAENIYREEEQKSVDWLLWYFGSMLDECEDIDKLDGLLLDFKTRLANIKTDAQLCAEELVAIKNELLQTFGESFDYSIYRAEQKDELEATVKEFKEVIAKAESSEECNKLLLEYTEKVADIPIAELLLTSERTEWVEIWQERLVDFAQRYSLDIAKDITDTLLLILEQESRSAADLCAGRFMMEIMEGIEPLGPDALEEMKEVAHLCLSSLANEEDYREQELEQIRALVLAAGEDISASESKDALLAELGEAEREILAIPTDEQIWQMEEADFAEHMRAKYGSYALLPPESLTVAKSVEELARIIDYYAFYQLDGESFERATFRVELDYGHKYAEWVIRDVYWCCELLRSAVGISGEFYKDTSKLVITLHPYELATVTNENRLEGAIRYDSLIEYEYSSEKDYTERAEDFEDFPCYELYAGRYVTVWNSQQLWYALEKEYIPVPVEGSPAEEVLLAAKDILREIIKDGMSIEEKVYAIYAWYSDNVYYDYAYEDKTYVEDRENFPDSGVATLRSFHAEGALLDKLAVCCSYAKSTLILMRLEGIEAYRVILHLYEDNAIDNLGAATYGSHAIIALRGSDGKFYYCDTEQCAAGDSLKYEKYMQLMVTADEQCPYNNAIDRIWNRLDYGESFPMELLWENLTYNGKSVFVKNERELKELIDEFCALGDKTKQINIFTFGADDLDVGEILDLDARVEYYYAGLGEFYEYMISYVGEPE